MDPDSLNQPNSAKFSNKIMSKIDQPTSQVSPLLTPNNMSKRSSKIQSMLKMIQDNSELKELSSGSITPDNKSGSITPDKNRSGVRNSIIADPIPENEEFNTNHTFKKKRISMVPVPVPVKNTNILANLNVVTVDNSDKNKTVDPLLNYSKKKSFFASGLSPINSMMMDRLESVESKTSNFIIDEPPTNRDYIVTDEDNSIALTFENKNDSIDKDAKEFDGFLNEKNYNAEVLNKTSSVKAIKTVYHTPDNLISPLKKQNTMSNVEGRHIKFKFEAETEDSKGHEAEVNKDANNELFTKLNLLNSNSFSKDKHNDSHSQDNSRFKIRNVIAINPTLQTPKVKFKDHTLISQGSSNSMERTRNIMDFERIDTNFKKTVLKRNISAIKDKEKNDNNNNNNNIVFNNENSMQSHSLNYDTKRKEYKPHMNKIKTNFSFNNINVNSDRNNMPSTRRSKVSKISSKSLKSQNDKDNKSKSSSSVKSKHSQVSLSHLLIYLFYYCLGFVLF